LSWTEPKRAAGGGVLDIGFAQPSLALTRASKARGARRKRSYVSADRHMMICEFEAADAEALQASLRAAETPFGRVWVG